MRIVLLPRIKSGSGLRVSLTALLLFSMLFVSGCGLKERFFPEDPPQSKTEYEARGPAYGTVSHVNYAANMDMEIHRGDIALTIDLDDGTAIIIIQPQDDTYTPGDRVRVVNNGKGLFRAHIAQQ